MNETHPSPRANTDAPDGEGQTTNSFGNHGLPAEGANDSNPFLYDDSLDSGTIQSLPHREESENAERPIENKKNIGEHPPERKEVGEATSPRQTEWLTEDCEDTWPQGCIAESRRTMFDCLIDDATRPAPTGGAFGLEALWRPVPVEAQGHPPRPWRPVPDFEDLNHTDRGADTGCLAARSRGKRSVPQDHLTVINEDSVCCFLMVLIVFCCFSFLLPPCFN